MNNEPIFITDLTLQGGEEAVKAANLPLSQNKQTTFTAETKDHQLYTLTFLKEGLPDASKVWAFMTSLMKLDFISLLPISGFSHPETSDFTYPAIFQKHTPLPTLLDLIKSGEIKKYSLQQKRSIAISVASCIRFLHTSKVVHNNLYLNNIYITPEGKAYVTSFGIPYAQTKIANARPQIWTPPENLPTEEGDIYDVGLVLRTLFTEEEPSETENPSIPDNCTPLLKKILTGCFEKNRNHRISDDSLITQLFAQEDLYGPNDFANRDEMTPYAAKQININVAISPAKFRFIQLCRFAEAGNKVAQNKVGIQFEKGIDCEKDDAQALRFFQMAAQNESLDAMCNLGRIYYEGLNRFAGRNIETAISYYERAGAIAELHKDDKEMAMKGGDALFRAGEINNGMSAFDDITEVALPYYERSAALGNTEAALKVGRFLFKHINNPTQRAQTGEFLRRAADAGSAPAQNEYARYLEKVQKDEDNALRYYIMAADQGHELALYNAGRILMKKKGDTDQISRGIEYMRLAAEKNNSLAMLKLGELLISGKLVERNAEEGFMLIKNSVELKNVLALNILGECYLFGTGCQQNIPEARRYFEQAANCRVPRGCTNFGHMLIQEGPTKYKEAFAVYRLAAEMNDPIGMVCCGQLLESGFGGQDEPHYSQAAAYYQRAAALGNSFAYSNLGRMYQNGKGVTQDSYRAVKMFKRAIEMGNTNAMYNMGAMYENGAGVQQSQTEADKYYMMAAERGNPQALFKCASQLEATGITEDRVRAAKMRRFAEIKMRIFSIVPDNYTIEEVMGPFVE